MATNGAACSGRRDVEDREQKRRCRKRGRTRELLCTRCGRWLAVVRSERTTVAWCEGCHFSWHCQVAWGAHGDEWTDELRFDAELTGTSHAVRRRARSETAF